MIIELLTKFIKWTNNIGQPKRQEKSFMQPESISAIKVKTKKEPEVANFISDPYQKKSDSFSQVSGYTSNTLVERETGVSSTLGINSTSMANSKFFNRQEFVEDLRDVLMGGDNINPVDITNRGNKNGTNMPGHRNAPPPPPKKKSKAK